MALISIVHKWLEATDGNAAAVRMFLLDYRKAFDLVDFRTPSSSQFPRALIDGLPIESVDKIKLFGLTINKSLTWNDHIKELLKKASCKLYFLVQFKQAKITL